MQLRTLSITFRSTVVQKLFDLKKSSLIIHFQAYVNISSISKCDENIYLIAENMAGEYFGKFSELMCNCQNFYVQNSHKIFCAKNYNFMLWQVEMVSGL